jgi:hypothetical protein
MKALLLGVAVAIVFAGAARAETRCGYIVNPTPGNWWLVDRHAEWIIATQGGRQARGMERMPDFTEGEWVGESYGYGCACMNVRTRRGAITRIYSVRQLALRKCRADRKLPKP